MADRKFPAVTDDLESWLHDRPAVWWAVVEAAKDAKLLGPWTLIPLPDAEPVWGRNAVGSCPRCYCDAGVYMVVPEVDGTLCWLKSQAGMRTHVDKHYGASTIREAMEAADADARKRGYLLAGGIPAAVDTEEIE